MNRFLLLGSVICFVLRPNSVPSQENREYLHRYIVSWDQWDGRNTDDADQLDFRLNGESIGRRLQAFKLLEKLPIEKGEHIRLDLPEQKPGHVSDRQVFYASSFLYRWLEKGAFVDLFLNGKRLNSHTLTWKGFIVDGEYVKSMDDVQWIVDGKNIGKGDSLAHFIQKWETEVDVVILKLTPIHWRSNSSESPVWTGTTYGRLLELGEENKLQVITVMPGTTEEIYMEPQK